MATNRQRLLSKGYALDALSEVAIDEHADEICEVCTAEIDKNLGPSNPSCDGRWCAEATELWLDKDVSEEDAK